VRTVAGGLVLAVALLGGLPAVAGASEESIGGCIIEAVEKLEGEGAAHEGEEGEALHAQVEKEAEACIESPNPILPATNEIIWGFLSFIILAFVLWKFALPPVVKTMEARTERIRNDLAEAESARVEAEDLRNQYAAQLDDARSEAQRIIDEARQSADALKVDLQRRAEADVAEMRQRAAADVESSKSQALADLRGDVANLALGAAERVIGQSLDRDTQRQLIDAYINQVGSSN